MFRTPKVGTRALAGVATIATVAGLTLPLMATAASAAVSAVTIDTANTDKQVAAGDLITVTANVTITAGDTTPIRYAIVSGPDADKGVNGLAVADGDCTVTPLTATTESAECAFTSNATAGTDVVRVFADSNSNQVIDNGEPSADASVIKYGAPAAVSITPASDSAAAGTCNTYTVKLTDSGARVIPAEDIQLETTLTGTTTGRTLDYCVPSPNDTTPAAQAVAGATQASGTTPATGTVTTNTDGLAVFGILSNQTGTASIRAYFDTNTDGNFDAGEPAATATKTYTAGGAAGNSAQDAVTSLTVDPASVTAVAGDSPDFTVTAKNSAGDVTPNVIINYTITGANPSSGTLAATNNKGQATLASYSATNAGTDTITFFVNQTTGATGGADANEPKATATVTVAAAPVGYSIETTCVSATHAGSDDHTCYQPLPTKTQTVTAFVSKGTDTNGDPIPSPGILVRWEAFNHSTPGLTTTVTFEGVTDANGKVVYNFTDANAIDGTFDHVEATIAGQLAGDNSDYVHVFFETRVPSILTVTPDLNTTQTGQQSTFTATLTDQFETAIAGANVDFSIGGRNVGVNGPSLLDKITNAAGQASITYTDTGLTNAPGVDTVTAVADVVNENDIDDGAGEPDDTATNNFITEPAVAGSVDLDVTGACGGTDPANDAVSYDVDELTNSNTVCAVVKTAGGLPLAGKAVTFTLSGVGTFVDGSGKPLTSPQTVITDGSGFAEIEVASTKAGAQNLTASIDGKSDSGTVTYKAAPLAEARFIDLKPEAGDIEPGKGVELTALVTDKFGNPVAGVTVDFTETGAGQFGNGTSSQSGVTGATGTVTVTISSAAGSTGTESVTASINNGAAATDCDAAAVVGPPAYAAGNCSDTEDYTFKPAAVGVTPTITVAPSAINIGKLSTVGATGTPGNTAELWAYTRPCPATGCAYQKVRTSKFDANGKVLWTVGPRGNTRLFVKDASANKSSASAVISVRPALSIFGKATGKVGSFNGGYVPGQANAAIRIYTVKNGVRSATPVGTATTDANGKWTYSRTFAASGPVTFIVQSLANLNNGAGQGNRVTITFS